VHGRNSHWSWFVQKIWLAEYIFRCVAWVS
jgi:hypothetical protein